MDTVEQDQQNVNSKKRYKHVDLSIDELLQLSPAQFRLAYPKHTDAIRRYLGKLLDRGFIYWPACGHHDAKGECLGHEEKEVQP